MKIYFGGGEVATHRNTLMKYDVEAIAVNLSAYFTQRQPLAMSPDVYGMFDVVLYSSTGGLDPQRVEAFVDHNIDQVAFVYGLRSEAAEAAGKYIPEWHGGAPSDFYAIAERYGRVGIAEAVALDGAAMTPLKAFARSRGIELWATSSKSDVMTQGIWTAVLVSGWLNAQKQRELQVWDGKQVSRYNRDRRDAAAEKHRRQIERLGHTAELIVDGDLEESIGLAITSWKHYERSIATIDESRPSLATAPGDQMPVAIASKEPRQRDAVVLPILTLQEPAVDSNGDVVPENRLTTSGTLLRTCDPCYLAQQCPKFEPGASCAYGVPVVIRTTQDRAAAMNAIAEMQFQRVMTERFAEEVLAQGNNDRTGTEIDRFMRVMDVQARVTDQRESLTIVAKGRAEMGAISQIFGAKAGAAQMELTRSTTATEEIVDADVID